MNRTDAGADLADLYAHVALPGDPLHYPGLRWDAWPEDTLSDAEAESEARAILSKQPKLRAVVVIDSSGTRRLYSRTVPVEIVVVPERPTAPAPPAPPVPLALPAPLARPAPSPTPSPKARAALASPAAEREWTGPVGVFEDDDPAWLDIAPKSGRPFAGSGPRTLPKHDHRTGAERARASQTALRRAFGKLDPIARAAKIAAIDPMLVFSHTTTAN